MNPQEFVLRWRRVVEAGGSEKANAQSHFIELCALLEVDPPTGSDDYTFERGLEKSSGGHGWADVWQRGRFGWEYKGPGRDLDKAYEQLLKYKDALENPPLLVVSDLNRIVVHTSFTNTVKRVFEVDLDGLLDPDNRALLRNVFVAPEALRPTERPDAVTREAAARFAHIADMLRDRGVEPQRAAHFLIRLLFCLFAEDAGLLPNKLFTRLVDAGRSRPALFNQQLRSLFSAMQHGTFFGADDIRHINGGLFDSDDVVELDSDAIWAMHGVTQLDWSQIEPAILGTLFVRSLDPAQRAQLGAQYTSREDILLIVEPVLMDPLRRRWDEVREQALQLAVRRDETTDAGARTRRANELRELLLGFMGEIAAVRVLDPACGSGNFLYVALLRLLDLWKQVWTFMGELALTPPMAIDELAPSPLQLHGIEINEYAHELAQVTVWIGYIQWLRENGFGTPREPILKPIESILLMDAILAYDADGRPIEPEWPAADVVVGNPPFLGGNKIRQGLSDPYVEALFSLYNGRVPAFADLACYWFELGRTAIAAGRARRVGLLATQGIRGGANRRVLESVKASGDIFWAQSDRDWILDGATVHVSMIGFDDGSECDRCLDGRPVRLINANLTASTDLARARAISENAGICFMGASPKGPFDIDAGTAQSFLEAPLNINGRPNSDVVRPVASGVDLVRRPRGKWTIDFALMLLEDAADYELPFQHVVSTVKPVRAQNRRAAYAARWWQYAEPRPGMRSALASLSRVIATPEVAKHRIFVWVDTRVLCNQQTLVFARDDDYFFGVLQSMPHELWSRWQGTQLREEVSGLRYTPTTTFETFPFPWPPGEEPADDPRVIAVADAARVLVEQRDRWLNPEGAVRGAEEADPDEPVQRAPDVAGPGTPEARRGRVRRVWMAVRSDGRGNPGEAAGAEPGEGQRETTDGQGWVAAISRFLRRRWVSPARPARTRHLRGSFAQASFRAGRW